MLVPEQGLWSGMDAQLGAPILKIVDVGLGASPPPPDGAVYVYVAIGRMEALERRVTQLESRTWSAWWRRVAAGCRHLYDRFMEQ